MIGKQQTAAPIEPFTPLYMSQFHGLPVPEQQWFIPGWIPMGRVTGLYGESTVGKTLASQMLMTSTALGRPWFGLHVATTRTLGVFCECDAKELHRRQEAINRHYGCDFADFELNMCALPRLGHDNLLMTFDNGVPRLTPFYHQLVDFAKDAGTRSVIIETAADVFGGDQNNSGMARLFVQQGLGRLAREIGGEEGNGVVILNAHPSRRQGSNNGGSGESGSVQWDATFRSRIVLERPKRGENGDDPDPNAQVLRLASANYAGRVEPIELLWQDGVFIRPDQPTGLFATIERRSCEAVFLEMLDKVTREGLRVSAVLNSTSYAPRIFAHRSSHGFKIRDFERAMYTLFDDGEIHNVLEGTPSRQKGRIVHVVSRHEAAQ